MKPVIMLCLCLALDGCELAVIAAGDNFIELAEDNSDDDHEEDEVLGQSALQDGIFTGGFVD